MERAGYLIVVKDFLGELGCTGILKNVNNVNRLKVQKRVRCRNCKKFSKFKLFISDFIQLTDHSAQNPSFIVITIAYHKVCVNRLFYFKFCTWYKMETDHFQSFQQLYVIPESVNWFFYFKICTWYKRETDSFQSFQQLCVIP